MMGTLYCFRGLQDRGCHDSADAAFRLCSRHLLNIVHARDNADEYDKANQVLPLLADRSLVYNSFVHSCLSSACTAQKCIHLSRSKPRRGFHTALWPRGSCSELEAHLICRFSSS